MKRILKCTKKYLGFIFMSPICIMCEVILEVYIPKVMAIIVDEAIPTGLLTEVLKYGGLMVLMGIASMLMGFLANYFASKGGIGFGSELRKEVFHAVQDFSFEDVDRFETSSLITRLTTDVDQIQQGMMMCIRMFVRMPFMLIMACVAAYNINADLMKIFLYAAPILIILAVGIGSIMAPRIKKIMESFDGLNDRVREDLTNIRVVKAYVKTDYENKRFYETNKKLYDASINGEKLIAILQPLMMTIIYTCIIFVWFIGGQKVMVGDMLTGQLMSFVGYVGQILFGLIMIAAIFISIMRLKTSISRINEVLKTQPKIVDGTYDGKLEDGSISFIDVCLKYNKKAEENILKNVSFEVESGQTIGILGATGCGKTTLVQLIPRLYDPDKGEIVVGKHNAKDYRIKTLRDSVAMVLQQNVLFSGTIEDNIKWGDENASFDEVKKVCEIAQADGFITSFPDGYKTDLGQGGVNLSGGQKQRLCIARALLKKPKIVILDDSTSAVDTATDALIRKGLKEELKDTTTIIIAQRISSVIDADKVMIMDNGMVTAFDTPTKLLETNEIFKDIYHTQMKGVN